MLLNIKFNKISFFVWTTVQCDMIQQSFLSSLFTLHRVDKTFELSYGYSRLGNGHMPFFWYESVPRLTIMLQSLWWYLLYDTTLDLQ